MEWPPHETRKHRNNPPALVTDERRWNATTASFGEIPPPALQFHTFKEQEVRIQHIPHFIVDRTPLSPVRVFRFLLIK